MPTGISVPCGRADRPNCGRSRGLYQFRQAATPAAAIAACTHLIEALARREIASSEGAAVHVARGNLHAVQGELDRAIADYDRAIMLDPNRAVACALSAQQTGRQPELA